MKSKASFFCDEIYSYSLANSQYGHIFPPEGHFTNIILTDRWLPGFFLKKHLCVTEKTKFNLSISDLNNFNDSHPPFYNYLIHIICSFFPNTFSKWYGLSLNIFLFILSQILLFFISKRIIKSEPYSLFACFLYGFSAISIDCFILIRVYSLLTFLCLLLLYLYLVCLDFNFSIKRFIAVIAVITLGALTHYHFYVYAFFLTFFYIIICLIKKKYLMFGFISLGAILGVVLANSYYPYILYQFSNSPRAKEAFSLQERISPLTNSLTNLFQEFLGLSYILSTYLSICLLAFFSIFLIINFIKYYLKETNTLSFKFAVISIVSYISIIYATLDYRKLGFFSIVRFILPACPIVTIITVAILKKMKNVYLSVIISILSILSGFFMLDYYYPYTDSKYFSYLELEKIIKNNNLIVNCIYKEAIQTICPILIQANKIYIDYSNQNNIVLPDVYPKTGKTYLFRLKRNYNKSLEYKKIIDGELWFIGSRYELYEL